MRCISPPLRAHAGDGDGDDADASVLVGVTMNNQQFFGCNPFEYYATNHPTLDPFPASRAETGGLTVVNLAAELPALSLTPTAQPFTPMGHTKTMWAEALL